MVLKNQNMSTKIIKSLSPLSTLFSREYILDWVIYLQIELQNCSLSWKSRMAQDENTLGKRKQACQTFLSKVVRLQYSEEEWCETVMWARSGIGIRGSRANQCLVASNLQSRRAASLCRKGQTGSAGGHLPREGCSGTLFRPQRFLCSCYSLSFW